MRTAASYLLSGIVLGAELCACSGSPLSPYTTGTPPLVLAPSAQAGVKDRRGRFREIYCAVLEAHGHQLPGYRPCDAALTRVGDEPEASGMPVDLGQSRRRLVLAFVPGLGWECIADWLHATGSVATHLAQFGYDARFIEVGGLAGSDENARRIRDAILAIPPDSGEQRLVLVGYSKGMPDILEAIVKYPEIRTHLAAVVSAAGAVGGSPLANSAKESDANLLQHWPGARCAKSDGHAVESLRPNVRQNWLAQNPLPRDIPYYSVVTFPDPSRISSVLRGSYDKLSKIDARNDSQLLFYDQVIPGSSLIAYVNADHWAIGVPVDRTHPWITSMFATQNAYPREALAEALLRFVEEDLPAQSPVIGEILGDL